MNYFVTGATGLVGRHLVAELLRREDATVYVLVRPGSAGRLEELRRRWGEGGDRVIGLAGDVRLPGLGVDGFDARIDHLFHVAAAYHLAVDPALARATNVEGTRRVVEFANAREVGTFHHTSTNGVAGRYRGRYLESMLDEGQLVDHPYFGTKLEAEKLVRAELRRPLRVYRPGIVVGSSRTGEMDKVDGAYYFFKLLRWLSHLPEWLPVVGPEGRPANLVPVDFVARAMVHIAHLPEEALPGDTFQLLDNHTTVGQAANAVARAAGAPRLVVRVSPRVTRPLTRAARRLPLVERARNRILDRLGIPGAVLDWRDFYADFDTTWTDAALAGTDVVLPEFAAYAATLYRYWNLHLEPSRSLARLTDVVAGKRVVVTGSSSGIGRALAERLGAARAQVLLVARRQHELEAVRDAIVREGGRAYVFAADLADRDAAQEVAERILAAHGGIDVLINNAGRSVRRSLTRSLDRFRDFTGTIDLNYYGALTLILAAVPGMRQRGEGHIVNVSTWGLQFDLSRFSAYHGSKAALDAFSRSAAPELAGDGVAITTVYMPLVRTPMSAPTAAFNRIPALTADAAAERICSAIVRRPPRVSTPVGAFAELLRALWPRALVIAIRAERALLPDTEVARTTSNRW